MRVLFATDSAFPPQVFYGSELSAHALALTLRSRGYQVGVLADLKSGDWRWLRNRVVSKLRGRDVYSVDKFCGYPVFRGWGTNGIRATVERFKPDIVILQGASSRTYCQIFVDLGIPIFIFIRDAEFRSENMIRHPSVRYLTNSLFLANRLRTVLGIEASISTPIVRPARCRVHSSRKSVLFINPVPKKGVEIAMRLAELRPDIPFDFVEGWERSSALRHSERVRNAANISWHKSHIEVKRFYGRAKLLLMPSQWEEAWGRCASEAQLSGIPVLASRIGGLIESVGPGGILVDPNAPIEAWLAALSQMWDDRQRYEAFSQEALKYSQRPQIQPEVIVAGLESLIREHAAQNPT